MAPIVSNTLWTLALAQTGLGSRLLAAADQQGSPPAAPTVAGRQLRPPPPQLADHRFRNAEQPQTASSVSAEFIEETYQIRVPSRNWKLSFIRYQKNTINFTESSGINTQIKCAQLLKDSDNQCDYTPTGKWRFGIEPKEGQACSQFLSALWLYRTV